MSFVPASVPEAAADMRRDLENIQRNLTMDVDGTATGLTVQGAPMTDEGEKEEYRRRIAEVEAEIEALEAAVRVRKEQKELQEKEDREVSRIIDHLSHASSEAYGRQVKRQRDDEDGLEARASSLEAQVAALARLTGVEFTRAESTIDSKAGRSATAGPLGRRFELAGRCHGVSFTMAFGVADGGLNVHDLDIDVQAEHANELAELVAEAKASRSPHRFFANFVRFGELREARRLVWEGVRRAYGSRVVLPHGTRYSSTAFIRPPGAQGGARSALAFVFTFLIEFENGRLSSSVELLPQASAAYEHADVNGRLLDIPDQFRKFVNLGGGGSKAILAALHAFVPVAA